MEKDIGKINKNDMTDIVIRVDDFGDRRGLTIREFVQSDRYSGFTKSGVRILAQDFPKFKEMINSIPDEDMKESSIGNEPEQGTLSESTQNQEVPVEKPGENKGSLPDY